MKSFHPIVNSTVSISATSTSSRIALIGVPTGIFQLRLVNEGPNTVFFNRGDSTVTATTSNMPLPAGAVEVITINNRDGNPVTHIAAICASSKTATLYATTGDGI